MRFTRENSTYFILFVVVGALLGGALGYLFAELVPALGFLKQNLTGFVGLSLDFIRFEVKLTLPALLGIVAGALIFAKA